MKKTLFLKTISVVILLLFVENISAQCWSSVVVGGEHTIGIKSDGTLWGWGLNSNGQLGNGTNVSSNIPIQIGTFVVGSLIGAFTSYLLLSQKSKSQQLHRCAIGENFEKIRRRFRVGVGRRDTHRIDF